MRIDFTNMLYSLSFALDAVEHEFSGATMEHGKRVAWLSYKMALGLGYDEEEMVSFVGCAILHDNAIAEYLREETENGTGNGTKSVHAEMGEKNVRLLPFKSDISNVILYHHENADGSGPLGKTSEEIEIRSEILHLADSIDINYDLTSMKAEEFDKLVEWIRAETDKLFSKRAVSQFMNNVSCHDIETMQKEGVLTSLKTSVPVICHDYSDDEVKGIALFFARIVDYKSSFTKDHSFGVAEKAKVMAEHYKWNHEKVMRYYFAGAMHDIGKLIVGNEILEKPDKLTADEFSHMKDHAAATYRLLREINGFEDIVEWAANHHEKLDGSGYFRGLCAEDLTFEDRLMACIDIYQALTEPRPYKDGMSHCKAMGIMYSMSDEGKIDGEIVSELDQVFGKGQCEPEELNSLGNGMQKYRCSVCGYIHEGEESPLLCPVCDSGQDAFEKLKK